MKSNLEIDILYFQACPSWKQAVENLKTVLSDLEFESQISLIRVETIEEAVVHQFVGSPTIRVDGQDLFPTDQDQYALGCRVYQNPEGFRGWPTVAMLKEKFVSYASS